MEQQSENISNDEAILDMDQAIALLKTSRPTFYRWLKKGSIKGMKVGRQWRFEQAAIERFMRGEQSSVSVSGNIQPLVKELVERLKAAGVDTDAYEEEDVEGEEALSLACDLMIELAEATGATDIHISPLKKGRIYKDCGCVRFRIENKLQSMIEFDLQLYPSVVHRWKALACCDLTIHDLPQDGRLNVSREDAPNLDLRVNFLPINGGESVTARVVIPDTAESIHLDRIGYRKQDHDLLVQKLAEGKGLFVFSGPMGSGKTTNLYACLDHIAGPERKTIAIENATVYAMPWVDQCQIDLEKGITFPFLMRSALRQSPDAILLDEIRDAETLDVAQEAVLDGHLVLTQLHCEGAISAVRRMLEVGTPAFVLVDTLSVVSSQRLVRALCPYCKVAQKPDAILLERAQAVLETQGEGVSCQWPEQSFKAKGCPHCRGVGYRGRKMISEVLTLTEGFRKALLQDADDIELRRVAVKEGMAPIFLDGLRLVEEGVTSFEELLRVAPRRF